MQAKPKDSGRFSVIPEGEKQCVWMEAGVVAYKICDRDFQCENCPLDIGLRGMSPESAGGQSVEKKPLPSAPKPDFKNRSNGTSLRFSVLSGMNNFQTGDDRYFHPKHTWIQPETPDRIYVGIDSIVATVLGSIDAISLPSHGQRIRRGESCCQVIQQSRAFSILSPVSGRIVEINEDLEDFPDKVILDSLGKGWLFCVEPDDLEEDLQYCRGGDSVFPWYMKELQWLDSVLADNLQRRQKQLGQTMYDGGELSRNLRDLLPPDEYRQLVLSFIGKPNNHKTS
jgi:glycine cleavage system H protein